MTREEILTLTTLEPVSYRQERYLGGAFSLSLEDFSFDEQDLLRRLYEQLNDLLDRTQADGQLSTADRLRLLEFLRQSEFLPLQEQLFALMGETRSNEQKTKETVLYGLASGALASITGYLFLVQNNPLEKEYIQSLYYLTRDHLKLMRNLISDLDPIKRSHDEAAKWHSLQLLKEKWSAVTYRAFSAEVAVTFDNYYEGQVAARCLEFSEIDNIFYHLANNTLQFGQNPELNIGVLPVAGEKHLRWVFANPISAAQKEAITRITADGVSLFEHGITTQPNQGEGFGLGSLAETIQHAYGLDDPFVAEEQGYFGWKIRDDRFYVWFHWPSIEE